MGSFQGLLLIECCLQNQLGVVYNQCASKNSKQSQTIAIRSICYTYTAQMHIRCKFTTLLLEVQLLHMAEEMSRDAVRCSKDSVL